jgi:Xaa-Pro aminopeptidase
MQLTEWPSFIKGDLTELKEGMVLTLEPGIAMPGGGLIVHEDNFVVRRGEPEQISPKAPTSLWEI